MTYIEFFDDNHIENICACLAEPPGRMVLIGNDNKKLLKHAARYREVFLARGYDIEFVCRGVNKNNLAGIVNVLAEIVMTYDNCVFDLTGGDDLYLVASGIVLERMGDRKPRVHRFNLNNNTLLDCDGNGAMVTKNIAPYLTAEENIRLYCGDIVYDDVQQNGTHKWVFDEEFCADIRAMVGIWKKNVKHWNRQFLLLQKAAELCDGKEENLLEVSMPRLEAYLGKKKDELLWDHALMRRLLDGGQVLEYVFGDECLSVLFKNGQIKRCLTKAGQLMELYLHMLALETTDEAGNAYYQDVMSGVLIDWDGKVYESTEVAETENEIDAVMMHGAIPVFVSCKSGIIEGEELYKLNTVAERFGGSYAKKVLAVTALQGSRLAIDHVKVRAADMRIRIIEGVHLMTEEALRKALRQL